MRSGTLLSLFLRDFLPTLLCTVNEKCREKENGTNSEKNKQENVGHQSYATTYHCQPVYTKYDFSI